MNTFTNCHACDRGGLGNAKDKCACGWQVDQPSDNGCYLGTPIVGTPKAPAKRTKSQQRYRDFLACDMSITFSEWLRRGAK